LLRYTASAEQFSSHVLADGILAEARERGIVLAQVSQASEEATDGVLAQVEGKHVVVGKLSFVARHAADTEETALSAGELAAYVSVDGVFAGAVVLTDPIRDDAAPLISWLRRHGIERITML